MFSLDGLFKALAAAVTLAFALIVLAGRGKASARGYLAAFLLLISLNQGFEAWRTVVADPVHQMRISRAAAAAAALDPAALAFFAAAMTPGRRAEHLALATGVLGGALALWGAWTLTSVFPSSPSAPFHASLSLFTMVTYTGVLLWALRNLRAPEAPRWWRPLTFALATAAIPAWTRAASQIFIIILLPFYPPPAHYFGFYLWMVPAMSIVVLATVLIARRWTRIAGGGRFPATAIIAALSAVPYLPDVALLLWTGGWIEYVDLTVIGRSSAPVRWLLFGGALSLTVLRDEAITFTPSARRSAARVVAALAAVVAVTLAFTALSAATQSDIDALPPIAWIVLAAALALSQGFRTAIERLASRLAPRTLAPGRPRLAGLATGGLVAGRYRVEALLGRGGGGRAFLASDETLRRRVVLKEVVGAEENDAALREARLAGSIQHPNVLTVHDILVGDDRAIIVTEYAAGGSVEDALARGPLPERVAMRLAEGVLDGLAAVHAAGIVHRDLKPGNVFLQGETPKIGDFGIAAFAAGRTAQFSSDTAGTPGFAAPEQIRGGPATKASDVYAAARIIEVTFPPPLPPALAPILARALDPDPARRYADAAAIREALLAARAQVQ